MVSVDEGGAAVVVVDEGAEALVLVDVVLRLLNLLVISSNFIIHHKWPIISGTNLDDVEGALVAQVDAVLVLLVHELARLELQALHARLQFRALPGARLEGVLAGNSNMVFPGFILAPWQQPTRVGAPTKQGIACGTEEA